MSIWKGIWRLNNPISNFMKKIPSQSWLTSFPKKIKLWWTYSRRSKNRRSNGHSKERSWAMILKTSWLKAMFTARSNITTWALDLTNKSTSHTCRCVLQLIPRISRISRIFLSLQDSTQMSTSNVRTSPYNSTSWAKTSILNWTQIYTTDRESSMECQLMPENGMETNSSREISSNKSSNRWRCSQMDRWCRIWIRILCLKWTRMSSKDQPSSQCRSSIPTTSNGPIFKIGRTKFWTSNSKMECKEMECPLSTMAKPTNQFKWMDLASL